MVEYPTSPPPHEFQAAVWFLKQPPVEGEPQARATGNDVKLELYGLFKQATCGDTSTPRPSRFNVQQRFKWDAWDSRRHMSKEKAMAEYVKLVDGLVPEWRSSTVMKGCPHEMPSPATRIGPTEEAAEGEAGEPSEGAQDAPATEAPAPPLPADNAVPAGPESEPEPEPELELELEPELKAAASAPESEPATSPSPPPSPRGGSAKRGARKWKRASAGFGSSPVVRFKHVKPAPEPEPGEEAEGASSVAHVEPPTPRGYGGRYIVGKPPQSSPSQQQQQAPPDDSRRGRGRGRGAWARTWKLGALVLLLWAVWRKRRIGRALR